MLIHKISLKMTMLVSWLGWWKVHVSCIFMQLPLQLCVKYYVLRLILCNLSKAIGAYNKSHEIIMIKN